MTPRSAKAVYAIIAPEDTDSDRGTGQAHDNGGK